MKNEVLFQKTCHTATASLFNVGTRGHTGCQNIMARKRSADEDMILL